jgi:hypothetical protein
MADIDGTGFGELDAVLELVRRTREVLDAAVADGEVAADDADFLADSTLPHVEGIQDGFRGWLRSEGVSLAELQYLLSLTAAARVGPAETAADRHAAAVEAWLESRAGELLRRNRPVIRNAGAGDLVRLAHARVVLAFIPRMPDEDVRFPAILRTYADIPAPRGPAELADRLAELERLLWHVATRRRVPPADPAFRRTYGFFDAADRLGWRAFPAA